MRKGEVTRLKSEAVTLRSQADTACYQGTTKRQYGFDSRKLLEEGLIFFLLIFLYQKLD